MSRSSSLLFRLLVTLLALAGGAEAIKVAAMAALTESGEMSRVQRALALDPGNAGLHYRLSRFYAESMSISGLVQATEQARRAVALNPHRFDYWLNLASACESAGDNVCADRALDHTLMLCPMVPRVWWMAGNQYLRMGQPQRAVACFHRLVELSPDYWGATFDLAFRAYDDPQMIFAKIAGGGSNARLALAFAGFMSLQDEFDAAHQAWSHVAASGARFPYRAAEPYIENLLSQQRYQEAKAVWDVAQAALPGVNLVYNGGFERPPLDSGFDWRSQPSPYVSIDFADPSAHAGARCLRLDFPVGQNDDFEPVYQIVPVSPHRTYTLTAYVRAQDITSDSGPRLRVLDPACPGCLDVSTASTVGTAPWHAVALMFTTGPQTQVVRLSVWRPRSRAFPMEISGVFWLDDVSLR